MTNTREQILLTTWDLLENQGFYATGINEIVQVSGAPKGSIYYYFPNGKEEIIAETILFAAQRTAERIQSQLAASDDPAEALENFLLIVAQHIESSGFRSGGPLTVVASETATTHPHINEACQAAYKLLRQAFKEKLLTSGMPEAEAESLAWTINAATEGAIILSRTFHTGDPLRTTAANLARLIRQR